MGKSITSTFEDVVRAIGIKPADEKWTVIFQRHAAFYSIDRSREDEAALLKKSKEEKIKVKVEHDALTSEIIGVSSLD